jgi:hypothetical protein
MDPIPIKYTRGDTRFLIEGGPSEYTLLDFWSWAFSDVLTNTVRGIIAEFIIATALKIDIKKPRDGWSKYDLAYRNKSIEVKSASYHQRWYQRNISVISFNIPKRRGWDANTNELDIEPKRQADIYVLSLLAERDRAKINPLNFDQWKFWIVEKSFFDKRKRSQHSITYNSLLREVGEPISYSKLKDAIDSLIEHKST